VILLFLVLLYQNSQEITLRLKDIKSTTRTRDFVFVSSAPITYLKVLLSNSEIQPERFSLEDILHFNIFSESSLKKMEDSEFRIYYESTGGQKEVFNSSRIRHKNTRLIDIFQVIPWLSTELSSTRSGLNQFHLNNPAVKLTKRGKYSSAAHERDKGLFRKILAIWHTLGHVAQGTVVIWLDTDTHIQKTLDARFDVWFQQYDVAFMPFFSDMEYCAGLGRAEAYSKRACKLCSETGIIAFFASEKTVEFLENQIKFYRGGALRYATKCVQQKDLKECQYPAKFSGGICDARTSLNDIAVFGHILDVRVELLRVGYLATGCRVPEDDSVGQKDWYQHATMYLHPGLCPSNRTDSIISPFNMLEYITHYHYSGSRISGLANKRKSWETGKGTLAMMAPRTG
jgi:hypothetical protein